MTEVVLGKLGIKGQLVLRLDPTWPKEKRRIDGLLEKPPQLFLNVYSEELCQIIEASISYAAAVVLLPAKTRRIYNQLRLLREAQLAA